MPDLDLKCVLVAEDHPVNQRVATVMLESLGFRVDVVGDGAEAVRAAAGTRYDVILMDCQIPLLDGYEATQEIRRLQATSPHTPIIAVTACDSDSDQERCLAAGMDDYLVKPLSMKTLAAALHRWTADAPERDRPVLDVTIVARLERLGESVGEDLVAQLAVLFIADADARVIELHEAFTLNDAAAVARCAHSMSGASANLGATHLARLFTDLELDGATGTPARGAALLAAAETELELVRAALGALEPTT